MNAAVNLKSSSSALWGQISSPCACQSRASVALNFIRAAVGCGCWQGPAGGPPAGPAAFWGHVGRALGSGGDTAVGAVLCVLQGWTSSGCSHVSPPCLVAIRLLMRAGLGSRPALSLLFFPFALCSVLGGRGREDKLTLCLC